MKVGYVGIGFVLGIAATAAVVAAMGNERDSKRHSEREVLAPTGREGASKAGELERENAKLRTDLEDMQKRHVESSSEEKNRIRELEAEILSLKREAGAPKKISNEKLAKAKEIYDFWRRVAAQGEAAGPEAFEAIKKLQELDPEMAGFFVQEYRGFDRASEKSKERIVTLTCALVCGGREAADLLKEILGNSAIPLEDRKAALSLLQGTGGFVKIGPIPMDADLARGASTLVYSQEAVDRAAGASLLGRVETTESRDTLHTLARTDASRSVQAAAIRSLGRVGDPSSLAILESCLNTPGYEKLAEILQAAIKQLKEKLGQ